MKEIKDYTYSDIIKADEGKLEIINENISNIYKMKEIKDFSFLDDEPEYEVKLSFIINELKRSADKYELNNMVLPIEVIKFIADNTTDYRTIEAACARLIAYANIDRIKNITLDMAKNKIFNNYFNKQDVKDESILEILETTSPYAFLKEKLGRTPSKEEVKLLEYLLIDKKLIPSGVNLLVDYILRTNNNQLDIELTKKFANCFKNSSLINTNENDIDILCKNYTFENFKTNDYNKFAYKVSLNTAKSPGKLYNPLFISANNKDKGHLLNAIGNYIIEQFNYNVIYLSAKQYIETTTLKEIKNKYEDIDVLIIDDIEYLAQNFEEQWQLLVWCDKLHHTNKQIIFGSNIKLDELSDFNEKLQSMFTWGMSVDIDYSNNQLTDENNTE